MKPRQLLISIAIVLLCTLALYLLIAVSLLQDPASPVRHAAVPAVPVAPAPPPADSPAAAGSRATASLPAAVSAPRADGARKLVEIFGRVTDSDRRPLQQVLIAEERYFTSVRSDRDGNYRLLLDLPRHRYPILHFLREGYDGRRVRLGKKQLDHVPAYELDVSLDDAVDSVNLDGRVANEAGIGLEGARVELSASYTRNRESFYLTRFTDDNGRFEFEGVRAGETYRLSVNLSPEYPLYENPDFRVAHAPAPLDIVLKRLDFADLAGMIVDREEAPVPGYEIYVSQAGDQSHTRKITSDSSGYFSLPGVPLGELDLSTRGSELLRISGLRLTAENSHNLRLVVDRGSHHLSGWVIDENGVAVEKAMVTLDRKYYRGGIEHSSYRSQRTDRNGAFAFANLGGGRYHVTVYALGYDKQDFNHDFDALAGEIMITLQRN